jgi:hypothetical protein
MEIFLFTHDDQTKRRFLLEAAFFYAARVASRAIFGHDVAPTLVERI